MKNFLRFFSLTTGSQVILLVNQLVLLPLQLRIWGHELVAQWLVVMAVAGLAKVADLGLHNCGHAELLAARDGDPAAAAQFRQIWALARSVIIAVTAAMVAGEGLTRFVLGEPSIPWLATLTVAMALDTVFMVRGDWLDTLGHIVRIEALFFAMSVTRFALLVFMLVVMRASPSALSWMYLVTSLGVLVAQSFLIPVPIAGLLAGGFSELRWRSLAVVRYVVAEPAASWVRIGLPVVVFGSFMPAAFITTFVAVRAVFGLARQVIGQVTRYASVRYVQRLEVSRREADHIALRAILASVLMGVAVSAVAVLDHGRLLRLWIGQIQDSSVIVWSFAAASLGYGYQVAASVLIRTGSVIRVARAHYIYLAFSGAAALLAYYFALKLSYLALLSASETVLAVTFVTGLGRRVYIPSVVACMTGMALLAPLIAAVEFGSDSLFAHPSLSSLLAACGVAAGVVVCMGMAALLIDKHLFETRRAA